MRELRALGVPRHEITLTRIEELVGGVTDGSHVMLIWADVVRPRGTNARLIASYLVFAAGAGVSACYSVVDANPILRRRYRRPEPEDTTCRDSAATTTAARP